MESQSAEKSPEQLFNEAMSAAQSEMGGIVADAINTATGNSKYATYPELDRVVRPVYTKHGFSLIFSTVDCPIPAHVRVICRVACGGHKETYQIDVPCDGLGMKGTPAMTLTHALGAATLYGRRYLLVMIFNLAIDKDDDGNAASKAIDPPITAKQAADLTAMIDEVDAKLPLFLKYLKIKSLAELPTSKYAYAVAALEKKRKAK